jgi:transposase
MKTAIIGVDISKHRIDYFDCETGKSNTIPFSKTNEWSNGLNKNNLVVFESTGIYSKRFARILHSNNINYSSVNPRQVRRYAQACGILAKNDRIDARVIASYASVIDVKISNDNMFMHEELRALVIRREQVVGMITTETCHYESCDDKFVKAMITKHINALKKQELLLKDKITEMLANDERAVILCSMPGVGIITAASILAYMPEIGSLNRGQIAALAGLAPYIRDSGNFRGKRAIYGGRANIRRVLYMSALVAIKHNNVYRGRYEKFKKNGKPFKVAITAIMRIMITTLNSMIKNNTSWKN